MAVGYAASREPRGTEITSFAVLAGISFSHLLNDTVQALVPAIYPMLRASFALTFAQVGLLTLTLQVTASLLQPVVGIYTDRRPTPYSLVAGMAVTLVGLLVLSAAPTFGIVLVAAGLMGVGSAVFHQESSRVARMAAGGRVGRAARAGAVAVPGRRQPRIVARAAARRVPDRAARPGEHRVVFAACAPRDGGAVEDWRLVRRASIGRIGGAPLHRTQHPAWPV